MVELFFSLNYIHFVLDNRGEESYNTSTAGRWQMILFFVYASQILIPCGGGFDHILCHRQIKNDGLAYITERDWPQFVPFTIFAGRIVKNQCFSSSVDLLEKRLESGFDHINYHRQTRNTRKQWSKNAPRANAPERTCRESGQSTRKVMFTSVGVVGCIVQYQQNSPKSASKMPF